MRQRVREVGNSYVVTIPKKEVKRLGLKPGDLVDVALTPLETRPALPADLREAFEASWEQHQSAYRRLAGY
jgi:putative addiction module antidote